MKPRIPLKKYLSSELFERLSMDICGHFPLTARRNKYLLVVSDFFSPSGVRLSLYRIKKQ
jgi:hypothetical protein